MNYRFAILILVLAGQIGCEKPRNDEGSDAGEPTTSQLRDGGITITEGPPKVTEDVEREIYRSLNHRRKMIAGIERNSGPSHALQQMRDELETLTQSNMTRYNLTRSEISAILVKGDREEWD